MLYIYEADCLHKLAALEGSSWADLQASGKPHTVSSLVRAWAAKQQVSQVGQESRQCDEFAEEPLSSFTDSGACDSNVIYGDGGWARYVVRPDGEVVLLGSTTRQERCDAARQQGIRVA